MRKNLLTACLLMLSMTTFAQKFTIPVFPDSQSEIDSNMGMFNSQLDWIIQNQKKENIPMVLHVGDVVNFDNLTHWDKASQGFARLDSAHIDYAITLGNHDNEAVQEYNGSAAPGDTYANVRKTSKFNSYFPTYRFRAQRGTYEPGKSDNAYYTFRTGNTYWLVVTLEFCPRPEMVEWANKIVKKYHEHNVIILTHYYLNGKGEIVKNNAGYGDSSPQYIFDNLVKLHPNIKFVISGHVGFSSFKVDEGVNHNKIYQMLQNYQNVEYGGGYLRLMRFDLDKGTVDCELYSPYFKKSKPENTHYKIEGFTTIKPKL